MECGLAGSLEAHDASPSRSFSPSCPVWSRNQHHLGGNLPILCSCNPLSSPFFTFLPQKLFPILARAHCPLVIDSQHHYDVEKAKPANLLLSTVVLKPCFNPCLKKPAFILASNATCYLNAVGHKPQRGKQITGNIRCYLESILFPIKVKT